MGKTIEKMTQDQWLTAVNNCGGDVSQDEIINLVYGDGPLGLWQDTVKQMMVTRDNLYNYLTGFFPTREWKDWQGVTEMGKIYHPAYIPFDLSIFQRSMQICSPGSMNECHTNYCEVPKGGVSNLPEIEMYRTGFKTQPMCMNNIRTSLIAKQFAEYIVNERYQVEEQVMDMFYTMAMLRMIGHKWTLEFQSDGQGGMEPVPNSNPYNMLQGFRYNYMNTLFPSAGNLENIMPFDFTVMDIFGRALSSSRNPNFIAKGPRNEPIYEMWHTGDWYRQEMLDNPEYVERMKYTKPTELLPGYAMAGDGTVKEIIGNFSMREVSALPKFAESTEGGLTVVQQKRNVAVDQGNRAIHNYREYDNAPFGLAVMIGKEVGEILTRPAINVGIEGKPIQPITGDGDWVYWNEYDKECNAEKNMPYFKRRFEMGFRPKNPDASWGFLHRTKKFRLRPITTCNLNPVFKVAPVSSSCTIVTIGANPLNKPLSNNIMDRTAGVRQVICSAQQCGNTLNYRLTVQRETFDAIAPDQNPLQNCACGDTIQIVIGDSDGDSAKIRDATIIDYLRPNINQPNPVFIVTIASALSANEEIQAISCKDATPTSGTVVDCADENDDESIPINHVRVTLDSLVDGKNVGSSGTLTFYDANNTSLGTVAVTVVSIDPKTATYELSSVSSLACAQYVNQVTVKLT